MSIKIVCSESRTNLSYGNLSLFVNILNFVLFLPIFLSVLYYDCCIKISLKEATKTSLAVNK